MKIGYSFCETMYGSFREIKPSGLCGKFDFSCKAVVEDIRAFLKDRMARISGEVTMDSIGEKLGLEGTMKIDPIFAKEIVYDFTFRAGDHLYRFLGRKNISFLDPIQSMTTLVGRIEKDGITYADVESHFNILDLPSFLLSHRLLMS